MTKPIKQLNQDLAALEEKVNELTQKLKQAYNKYLEMLGQSIQRQLVMASYQICTQRYPKAFLKLSFQERQDLQQSLQQLGVQTKAQLLNFLESPLELGGGHEELKEMLQSRLEEHLEDIQELREVLTSSLELDPPSRLVHWQLHLEQNILDSLQEISKHVNHLLYEKGILPRKLPAKLLDAALEAEEAGATMSGPPNILNVLIEIQNPPVCNPGPARISVWSRSWWVSLPRHQTHV
ncbi:MAG: hypothetical protein F6K24_50950 [Okeania sp. SIO2D1]|nr:hypothetical protein [Okeania sp. SIO2D1]